MKRSDAPVEPPVVLTIAGSDAGGGAGIQADLKTIEATAGFGTSVVTSVTAQNTQGVAGQHPIPVADIEAQLQAVLADFDVAAVKTGMLGTREVIDLVADHADALPNLVVDPVMVAASGDRLLEPDAEAAYERLVVEAALVTPNADEAAVLTGRAVDSPAAAERAGRDLVELGADAALVKGGHLDSDRVVDTLVADGVTTFTHDRVATDATHGSGCALSAAVATRLAHGDDLADAVGHGVDLLARAVRYHHDVGEGPGAVHHLVGVRDEAARADTRRAVRDLVDGLDPDLGSLVGEAGLTVAGATPYAERPDAVAEAAVAGQGAEPGVPRFGADGSATAALLAAREADGDYRFAAGIALGDRVESALDAVGWPAATVEDDDPPAAVREAVAADRPAAVCAPGVDGLPGLTVLATDPATLRDRLDALAAVV